MRFYAITHIGRSTQLPELHTFPSRSARDAYVKRVGRSYAISHAALDGARRIWARRGGQPTQIDHEAGADG